MKLFNDIIDETKNLLPKDGVVNYYGKIIPDQLAHIIFCNLLEHLDWKHDEATVYGKHYVTKRKVAWYGDKPFEYTYSGKTKKALPFTPGLLCIEFKPAFKPKPISGIKTASSCANTCPIKNTKTVESINFFIITFFKLSKVIFLIVFHNGSKG